MTLSVPLSSALKGGCAALARIPIRLRVASASTVAAIVLLLGAGLIFITTLRSGLQNSLDDSLRSAASEVSAQIDDGSTAAQRSDLQLASTPFGQLLSPTGTVLRTTESATEQALVPADRLATVQTGTHFLRVDYRSGRARTELQLRVLTVSTNAGIVVVGASHDVVDEPVERAGKQLLVVGAVVLLVTAAGSWLLARAALRPVERMRAQAAEIEARDVGGGLSVPPARDEVGRLATTLNDLLARLHAALARERAFVADAGHELRTPLTVLSGELELARRPGRSRDELIATVEVASEETARLIRLAEDLLVLARDDSEAQLRWTQFDVAEVLRQAQHLFESPAARDGVTVAVLGASSCLAVGDPDRIRQAIDNVVANAVRFAPSGSTVDVRLQAEPGRVTIEVLDAGPGFAPELLPHAFERFRRGDTVRTRSGPGTAAQTGSGLGLAIVRAVMRSHLGDAEAANRTDGPGARVTLWWPVNAF